VPDIAPRRWLYLFLVLASTVAAVTQMAGVFQVDGFTLRETVILALFAILFAWIASSFWLAVFGAYARVAKINLLPLKPPGEPTSSALSMRHPRPATAYRTSIRRRRTPRPVRCTRTPSPNIWANSA